MKLLLTVLAMAIAATSCTSTPHTFAPSSLQPKKRPSTVRLHNEEGRFNCSGVVISPTLILTAAHCISGLSEGAPSYEIRGSDERPTGIISTVAGYNDRADVGLLRADVSDFEVSQIETDPSKILEAVHSSSHTIQMCGYPWGGKAMCSELLDRHPALFGVEGRGFLFPGMSGGPVFDVQSRKVIAVNSYGTSNEVGIALIVNLFEVTGVKP